MAPEYMMRGNYSVKSDVFSFGVMVLEIVTGRKNNDTTQSEDLLTTVCIWRLSEQIPQCGLARDLAAKNSMRTFLWKGESSSLYID